MDRSVAEDLPAWGHALHAHDASLDFMAYAEGRNIVYSETETTEQASEWPFGEFPLVNAVQEMYRPEPKQMPRLCFRHSYTGEVCIFLT